MATKKKETKIFMLELETRYYSFQCFAETEKECYEHFWKSWVRHCESADLSVRKSMFPTKSSLTGGEYAGDLNLTEIKSLPLFLRDGHEIKVEEVTA